MNMFQNGNGKWVIEFEQSGEIPSRSIVFDTKEDADHYAEPWLKLERNATVNGPLFEKNADHNS